MVKRKKIDEPLEVLLENSQNLAGLLTKKIVEAANDYKEAEGRVSADELQDLWSKFSGLVAKTVHSGVISSLGATAHIQLYQEALKHKEEFLEK